MDSQRLDLSSPIILMRNMGVEIFSSASKCVLARNSSWQDFFMGPVILLQLDFDYFFSGAPIALYYIFISYSFLSTSLTDKCFNPKSST